MKNRKYPDWRRREWPLPEGALPQRVERGTFVPHEFHPQIEMAKGNPSIVISRQAFDRMRLFVRLVPVEVAWLGTVKELPGGSLRIEEVFLHRQEVSGGEATLTSAGLQDFAKELLAQGEAGVETWNAIRFWGHSHVFMDTNPSPQDRDTMEWIRDCGHPWFIRGIFNKLGRASFSVYYYTQGVQVHDVPWVVEEPDDPALEEAVAVEIGAKVSEQKLLWRSAVKPERGETLDALRRSGGLASWGLE